MTTPRSFLLSFLMILAAAGAIAAQPVRVSGGWHSIDGHKFFVKGVGYETNARPGHVPWVYAFDSAAINVDLARIKAAGFNTVRTWSALSEEELKLVQASGLKILFGIWIDNAGDFSSPAFRASALAHVGSVLDYTRKYDCVIGYLIMNEPQVDHIYQAGPQNLRTLWLSAVSLIHEKHPGIPVSFSNTMIGDYIGTDLFDLAAYNAYIYNPATMNAAPGYVAFLRYLKENRAADKPFLVTEYGLSVSPGTPSLTEYTYGGNTLARQAEGDLAMYRAVIDAGAQGAAVFQYHDGWWKGGNEWVHDPLAEEWFGLIGFADLADRTGTPRPAWQAFSEYNRAIITEPKNEAVYSEDVPVEIFASDTVRSFTVTAGGVTLLGQQMDSASFRGSIHLAYPGMLTDARLTFQFFDAMARPLKSETITILSSKQALALPSVSLGLAPARLTPGGRSTLSIQVDCDSLFTIEGGRVDYVSHPHMGFDNGTAKSRVVALLGGRAAFSDYFDIPLSSHVTTFAAGFTIRRGAFTRRISSQTIQVAGAWADPIKAADVVVTSVDGGNGGKSESGPMGAAALEPRLFQNYPNPFNPSTVIGFELPHSGAVSLKVFDVLGREAAVLLDDEYKAAGRYELRFDAAPLPDGLYFYALRAGSYSATKRMLLVK